MMQIRESIENGRIREHEQLCIAGLVLNAVPPIRRYKQDASFIHFEIEKFHSLRQRMGRPDINGGRKLPPAAFSLGVFDKWCIVKWCHFNTNVTPSNINKSMGICVPTKRRRGEGGRSKPNIIEGGHGPRRSPQFIENSHIIQQWRILVYPRIVVFTCILFHTLGCYFGV